MVTTNNQITDIYKKEFNRDPTPYEMEKYSKASVQDLANLKSTYAKYDPNSLVGYLGSTGQDNSVTAMENLAKQYGITNFGTAEGNTALLSALKAGAPGTTPIGGSLFNQNPIDPANRGKSPSPTGNTQLDAFYREHGYYPGGQEQKVPQNADGTVKDYSGMQGGSVGGAGASFNQGPPQIEGLDGALSTYQNIQKQVADIDKALRSSEEDIKAETARVGGFVSASQLKGLVYNRNKPLLEQRTQLVSEQAQAGKMYTDLLARQKESDNNYWKNVTTTETANKNAVAQDQKQQQLDMAANKPMKVNVTDSAGNILGQSIVTWHNPAGTMGIDSNGNTVSMSTDASGNITVSPVDPNTGKQPFLKISDGATPAQVLNSLITGPSVVAKGDTRPISQETLFNAALDDMLGVANTLATGMGGSAKKSLISEKKTEIMNAFGIDEMEVNAIKAQMKGMSSANTALLKTGAFMNAYANSAKDYIKLAQEQSALVPRGGAKILNKYQQWLAKEYTPTGPLSQLELYIYAAGREYAKVTTGGVASISELSVQAQKKVDELINAAQAPEVFTAVTNGMINDMDKVTGNIDKQANKFPDAVKNLYGQISGAYEDIKSGGLTTVTNANGETQNIGRWAQLDNGQQNPDDITGVQNALNKIGKLNTPQDITDYIKTNFPNSPITADMITKASAKTGIPWENLLARFQQDSSMGTKGTAVQTKNPGNVGNTNDGSTQTSSSWEDGVIKSAELMAKKYPVIKATPTQTKSGAPFDYQKAKDAGYNEQEIQDFINNN